MWVYSINTQVVDVLGIELVSAANEWDFIKENQRKHEEKGLEGGGLIQGKHIRDATYAQLTSI